MHTMLIEGSGLLLQSDLMIEIGRAAVRVAYSLAMLMEKGACGLDRRWSWSAS